MSEYPSIVLPKKAFFTYDISQIDVQLKTVLQSFYQFAEQELYEWENVDFPLPLSIFSGLNVKKFDLGIKDYLNIDECKQLARDSDGQPKPLSKQQLREMREYGTFKVQSAQFPDKFHVWRIHCLLQKGTSKVYADFRRDLSRVVNLIIITARNRIISPRNSIFSASMHLWRGLYLALDLIFGMPHNNPGNIETKLDEECLQFLTCELNVSKINQEKLHKFWDYMEQLSCLPEYYGADKLKEYFRIYDNEGNIPFGIYQFLTPFHLSIDFRLANRALKLKCLDIVNEAIREVDNSDWFIEFRTNYIEKICDDSCSLETIEKDLSRTGLKAKVNKVFEIIQKNCKKSDIPDAISDIMIENAKYFLICSEIKSYLKEMWLSLRCETSENLRKTHSFLSQTTLWVRKQLKKTKQEFLTKHEFTKLKMVIDRCASEELKQHEYFSNRYLLFMKERKPLIEKELVSNSSFPDRQYSFKSKMILPHYWKVKPITDGYGKQIFKVEKYISMNWTSRYAGWRWINYFLHTYMLLLTIGQFLLIKVPFKTPVSYLSLVLRKPFCTKYQFDSKTGSISILETYVVSTMYSRLIKLWRYVWECRNKFENSPFHGLLDKSVARHFHRLWVIVLQGGFGTLGIVLVIPVFCVFFSSLCCILGILVPFWVPVISLMMYLGAIMIYDFQKADKPGNRILCIFEATIWHLFLCGVCQMYLIIAVLLLVLPLLAALFLVWGVVRISIRYLWDTSIFYMILRKYAHIPATNDFVSKRISGPGLAYDYEILVKPEHVLLGLRCLLEKEELDLWLKQVSNIIKQPLCHYRDFISRSLGPLAVTLDVSNNQIMRLQQIEQDRLKKVHMDYNERMEMLNIKPYTVSDKDGKLRLSSKNLKIVLDKSEKLCEVFYNEHLKNSVKGLFVEEGEWWNKRNVKCCDFRNLAINNLSYLFGEEILSSIEDCDEIFHLEVNSLTVSAYMSMFVSETYNDDSDQIIVDQIAAHKTMDPQYLQIKLRNFMLLHFSSSIFFGYENESFTSALMSCPIVKRKKKSRRWIFTHLKNWLKCCANYYESVEEDDQTLSIDGSMEPWNLTIYHPLIICMLLHSRDRDNSMIHLDHKAVREGINDCFQLKYGADFLDPATNMTQSIDCSMSSLDNLSCGRKSSAFL